MSPSNMVNYPKSLTLTDDSSLECALGDIPFSAVGILGLGTFLFFLSMQRITKIVIYLHISTIMALLGGILDIVQIIRRSNNSFRGPSSSISAILISSEIGFALSTGFRYIFFWAFTGEPPHGESLIPPMIGNRRLNFSSLIRDASSSRHSGDWSRWGFSGLSLKWCLLALSCAIIILQGIWRLDNQLPRNSTVYVVESTMEIVLSALFVLKLVANLWLSPLTPRWKTLRNYFLFLFALLINMGLGVGNILIFQFSESVLGRFLQALILSILSTAVLIFSFHKMSIKSGIFEQLMRKNLLDRVIPDTLQEKDVKMMELPALTAGARDSVMSKISTWIGAQEKLEKIEDIEAGERPGSYLWEQNTRAPSPNNKQSTSNPKNTLATDSQADSKFTVSTNLPGRSSMTSSVSEKSYAFDNISKHQEQLERSLAGLQQFRSKKVARSNASPVQSIGASFRSFISLSNFPNPPQIQPKISEPATKTTTKASPRQTSRSVFMDNTEFQLVSPYPYVSPIEQPRKSSVPFTDEESYVGEEISRLGSTTTRYDVTSFIGDLSEPVADVSTDSMSDRSPTFHNLNGGINVEHTTNSTSSSEILNVDHSQESQPVPVVSNKDDDDSDALSEKAQRNLNGVRPLLLQQKGRIGLPERPLMRPGGRKSELNKVKDSGFF